jgi:hypothetical protein
MVRGIDLVLIGLLVIVVPFAILFFLAVGPVGWLLVGGGIIVAGIVLTVVEDGGDDEGDSSKTVERVNCPECGARNVADRDHCDYCGSEL